ncbi:MAG: hypothetical protein JSS44_11705 [Proteobacteria bacterium]|nr:hypothetical protein [Pseudomonadota bacterium]MBS0461065.1 hypothetical protein [Pseudomonadota bacterium]
MSASPATAIEVPEPGVRRLARVVLFVFLLTFICARLVVYLIMARRMPDLYLHMGGTHVHHLNYGIFLLCGAGAWLLFAPPRRRWRTACAALYAIGLGLTFDEFGMWLHLGGSYWQRASFDAVIVVAALLGLIAFAPAPKQWSARHLLAAIVVVLALALFGTASLHLLQRHEVPQRLHQLERNAPQ